MKELFTAANSLAKNFSEKMMGFLFKTNERNFTRVLRRPLKTALFCPISSVAVSQISLEAQEPPPPRYHLGYYEPSSVPSSLLAGKNLFKSRCCLPPQFDNPFHPAISRVCACWDECFYVAASPTLIAVNNPHPPPSPSDPFENSQAVCIFLTVCLKGYIPRFDMTPPLI